MGIKQLPIKNAGLVVELPSGLKPKPIYWTLFAYVISISRFTNRIVQYKYKINNSYFYFLSFICFLWEKPYPWSLNGQYPSLYWLIGWFCLTAYKPVWGYFMLKVSEMRTFNIYVYIFASFPFFLFFFLAHVYISSTTITCKQFSKRTVKPLD